MARISPQRQRLPKTTEGTLAFRLQVAYWAAGQAIGLFCAATAKDMRNLMHLREGYSGLYGRLQMAFQWWPFSGLA
jgi:hypothetical protein